MYPLALRGLSLTDKPALEHFFQVLENSGITERFHPHPFTTEEAHKRVTYQGKDLYYILTGIKTIYAYGMLRGWDAGYTIPSLGIAVHPQHQGKGFGRLMMLFLHSAARENGASQIRLKVYPDNVVAYQLYQSLGYQFTHDEAGQRVGLVSLV